MIHEKETVPSPEGRKEGCGNNESKLPRVFPRMGSRVCIDTIRR